MSGLRFQTKSVGEPGTVPESYAQVCSAFRKKLETKPAWRGISSTAGSRKAHVQALLLEAQLNGRHGASDP
eukprot:2276739-Amphidinium_carterae.1